MGNARNLTQELAMTFRNLLAHSRFCDTTVVFALLLASIAPRASAQDHSMHSVHAGHDAMSMAMDKQTQLDASQQSKLLADKKESELNPHLGGFFVLLA